VKRELGVSTVYVARSVVQHVGKDPRNFFSLHGIMRRCLRAERSGVPARLPGAWPKVPPERTVSSVSGAITRGDLLYLNRVPNSVA
jgi:hypothetical protein